jgi:hypothetical protein
MSTERSEPTKAQMLAALVTGGAGMSAVHATVQRSYRIPLHVFTQIENLANVAQVPVSVIVNELLVCGLDAVGKLLPPDIVKQVGMVSKAQIAQATNTVRTEIKRRKAPGASKLKSVK